MVLAVTSTERAKERDSNPKKGRDNAWSAWDHFSEAIDTLLNQNDTYNPYAAVDLSLEERRAYANLYSQNQ